MLDNDKIEGNGRTLQDDPTKDEIDRVLMFMRRQKLEKLRHRQLNELKRAEQDIERVRDQLYDSLGINTKRVKVKAVKQPEPQPTLPAMTPARAAMSASELLTVSGDKLTASTEPIATRTPAPGKTFAKPAPSNDPNKIGNVN